ncbi:MAG: hybrid sensor histidine kinase/response regulator [Magnetococcales bacterium]|nr:hybrid sensor histidine kinase/response regulator [Magnetococcales bacterium]
MHDNIGIMKKTILVADDAPESLTILRNILSMEYIVRLVNNGNDALRAVMIDPLPDLVLLDIMMPDMDGYEVCRYLKNDPKTKHIPVVFLTSRNDQEDEIIGLKLGAADFIRKPSSPAVVLLRCNNIITLQDIKKELDKKNEKLHHALLIREDMERLSRHDLKGPLTGIIGGSQVLLASEGLTERQNSILCLIEKCGYNMLNMVNSSLDLFKMENGTYQFVPEAFNLTEIVETVTASLKRSANMKSISFTIHNNHENIDQTEPFEIMGEKMLCYSIFYNLLLNAIEASNPSSNITINFSSNNKEQVVTISNPGEVPLDIRDCFFDKYTTSGKRNGTGLGTYTAWLSAKTQNGKIELDASKPGETSVIITFINQ